MHAGNQPAGTGLHDVARRLDELGLRRSGYWPHSTPGAPGIVRHLLDVSCLTYAFQQLDNLFVHFASLTDNDSQRRAKLVNGSWAPDFVPGGRSDRGRDQIDRL